MVVAEKKKYHSPTSSNKNHSAGVHKAVANDIHELLYGKNISELQRLSDDIQRGLADGTKSDIEYWEHMLIEIKLEISRIIVKETHKELLQKQLLILQSIRENELESISNNNNNKEFMKDRNQNAINEEYRFITLESHNDEVKSNKIQRQEAEVDNSALAMDLYRAESSRDLEDQEEKMEGTDEIALPGSTYWWQDKYRPRKPRYYNRVRTGYDWNKYNATHYDHDNPPPKTVQGYKFSIFYPDLIDKTKTPQYFLEAAEVPDLAIIRFHAGPPYEDIAFKIVNKQWDVGRKSGFRCTFERGILQLHFNFKRSWYRR